LHALGVLGTMSGRVSEVIHKVSNQPGTLYVVATPIGNLDDLSARAIRVLGAVDLIAAEDTRHTRKLCAHFGIETPMLALHEHNENEASTGLVQKLRSGARIALVSDAGTPLVSDPGYPLLRACREEGIPVSPIPGPCALTAALSVAGLPTDRFRFEGFLPRQEKARRERLRVLAAEPATLVFYESVHRIKETLADLVAAFGADRAATVARELTKLYEELRHGTLGDLLGEMQRGEVTLAGEYVVVVAGAPAQHQEQAELERVLVTLLEELPSKQAVALAAKLTGEKRNLLYELALQVKGR
jgi:16S rRNA (cytidine1402-2'-O)-methyltransferase